MQIWGINAGMGNNAGMGKIRILKQIRKTYSVVFKKV